MNRDEVMRRKVKGRHSDVERGISPVWKSPESKLTEKARHAPPLHRRGGRGVRPTSALEIPRKLGMTIIK